MNKPEDMDDLYQSIIRVLYVKGDGKSKANLLRSHHVEEMPKALKHASCFFSATGDDLLSPAAGLQIAHDCTRGTWARR